jgi:hypothetical protein
MKNESKNVMEYKRKENFVSGGSVEANVFQNSFCDGVLHGHVNQLDVLRVRGARRLHEDLALVRVRVP